MSTIASGVIMRIGTYDTAIYPDRTQREVHPARRDESLSYKIVSDDQGIHTERNGERWEHYRYTFTYRYLGRTISISFRTGVMYGVPEPIDALRAAFRDAHTTDWEAFTISWAEDLGFNVEDANELRRAERSYNACVRQSERLTALFGSEEERDIWDRILDENNDKATHHHYAVAGTI